MARGGARENAGRPAGVPNKRTQERIERAAQSGAADPLESILGLQAWALREMKRATAALATFDKEHGKRMAQLENDYLTKKTVKQREKTNEELAPLTDRRRKLTEDIAAFAARAADYANRAAPYMHARLASVDATVGDRSHEQALDDLDDDGPPDGDAGGA